MDIVKRASFIVGATAGVAAYVLGASFGITLAAGAAAAFATLKTLERVA